MKSSVGQVPVEPAVKGQWTAAAVQHATYSQLAIGGVAVAWQARCEFSFEGVDSNGAVVKGSETLVLDAGPTRLMGGGRKVLRHGDRTSSTVYGNALEAKTTRPLRSS
ncbi:MAG: hypothetical protein U1F43_34105 [Myxococcota bacterium]